jgi:NADPH:quinone reductase
MNDGMAMRAMVVDDFASGLFRLAEVARPDPKDHEVLIRVVASGVNPLDSKIRTGKAPHGGMHTPAILGTDMSGVVEAVGAGVSGLRVGDEVFAFAGGVAGVPGSLAEFAVADAALVAKKPKTLTHREAAALPLAALTAWEGVDRAKVTAGQQVVVTGGAGGVGSLVVQMANGLGAEVFATVSPNKQELVRQLGGMPIDRTATADEVRALSKDGLGFDVVYDTVGAEPLDMALQVVRDYGQVVSCYGWGTHDLKFLSRHGATYSGVFVLLPMLTGRRRMWHGEALRRIAEMVDAGLVRPVIDPRRFMLEQAAEAHEAVESGKATGKIVVDVAEL